MDLHDQPTEPMNSEGQEWSAGRGESTPEWPQQEPMPEWQQHQHASAPPPPAYDGAYYAPPSGASYTPPGASYTPPGAAYPPSLGAAGGGRRGGVAPRAVAGIAALSLLIGGAAGAGAGAFVAHNQASGVPAVSSGAAEPVAQSERIISSDVSNLTVKVVQQVGPAVVSIRNDEQPQQDIFGMGTSQSVSAGSGVVIDSHGYILTNYHVVADAQNLTVTFANATSAPATIVGSDPSNDIAVIKVNTRVPAVARFGDSSKVKVGETVIAIGNALGNLQNTVTEGIVSGVNRTLPNGNDATGQASLQNMIQTDAAINHGNSGGPLVDLGGNVIGINTAVVRSSGSNGILSSSTDQAEGLGFAIPSNSAKALADRLIFHTPSPSLGVLYNPVSPQKASSYSIPSGAWVLQVSPDSPAAKAGLRARDIITAVDGQAIDDQHDLKSLIEAHHVGDTIKLTVYRTSNGQTLQFTATLGKSTS
jgi:2-alkenal reductase